MAIDATPAVGYIVCKKESVFLYTRDTGLIQHIRESGKATKQLKAVFVETSFPDRLRGVAENSGHLTPAMLKQELKKIDRKDVPIFLTS
jgi:hypothetical protein